MFLPNTHEAVLPFHCAECLLNFTGRCDGPHSRKAYLMEHPSVFGCADTVRREIGFSDAYDRAVPIPISSHQDRIQLPSFIPGVKSGLNLTAGKHIPLFAVSLGDIVGAKGKLLVQSVDEIKHRYKLPSGTKLALICTAKDAQLQALWKVSDRLKSWEQIAKMGFAWVTSLSFSVWDDHPRFDQIISQDRNFLTHDYFANFGVPSIPFAYPFDDSDYRAFGAWMKARPDINKVAVYARFYKTNAQFVQFRLNMKKIQEYAQRRLEFLVVGAATRRKIVPLMTEFNATIVTWKPFQKARAGQICTENLEYEVNPATRDELANASFKRHLIYCDELREQKNKASKKAKGNKANELVRKMELPDMLNKKPVLPNNYLS